MHTHDAERGELTQGGSTAVQALDAAAEERTAAARRWKQSSDATERSRIVARLLEWIRSTDHSALELISDAARRRRLLVEVDWSKQTFPRDGVAPDDTLSLFREMARVVPERRVPQGSGRAHGIAYHEVDAVVVFVPGEDNRKLYPEASEAFVRMRDAARADGLGLDIRSAWRSRQRQAQIRARQPNSSAVARGISAHNYGLAVDLSLRVAGLALVNGSTESMTNIVRMYRSPIYKWLALRASDFGWFPYRNEPWHWEYNPDGFRERFEAAARSGGMTYGTPLGLFERYLSQSVEEPVAEAKADIQPRYDAREWIGAPSA